MSKKMKIVVIGGNGRIGTRVVNNLRQRGHEVVVGSPSTGVNTITGEGLADALTGAEVVVDVANAPVWEDKAVLEFFETSGRNLLAAEATAGVRHHVALSVVGTERLLASGYFRAKLAQEALIKASPIPYTIVRATQFFEFVGGIAQEATEGQTVRVPAAMMQPISSDDVAAVVANVALAEPLNNTIETAGPDPIRQDELVRQFLEATGDPRTVVTEANALYYNIALQRPKPHSGRQSDPRSHAFQGLARQSAETKRSRVRLASSAARSSGLRLDRNHLKAHRLGEPGDIAAVAVFLSSDASSWITGETIRVGGGARRNERKVGGHGRL